MQTKRQMIRDVIATLPEATTTDIVRQVKKLHGVKLERSHVQTEQSKLRKELRMNGAATVAEPAPVQEAFRRDGGVTITELQKLRGVIDRAGVENTRRLVELLV